MSSAASTPAGRRKRRRPLIAIATLIAVTAAAYAVYWFMVLRSIESTDDAYVAGNLVQVTPQVGGTVLAIRVDDTDYVKAGQPLVILDPADARVALDQVEAQLGQTVREVRTLYANNSTLEANVRLREADVQRARSDVERAQSDLDRRQSLTSSGAVSAEELNHVVTALANAKSVLAAAQAAIAAAQEQLTSNRALTEGVPVESHPNVQRAAARVREAYLALTRTELPAPVSGYVAKRSVQVGSRVTAGATLMAIVPLDQVWVDANFREVQLRHMRIGQPVTLTADAYGDSVDYHGKVSGLGVGTGAVFSLLPAQNATGNWIKVVQRVPVRVELDPTEVAAHPLRVGLSMLAQVDTRDRSGPVLASAPRAASETSTRVFDATSPEAEALVSRIIAANLGRKPGANVPVAANTVGAAAR